MRQLKDSVTDGLEFLYEGKIGIKTLGDLYRPPRRFVHGDWHLVATIEAPQDSDGQTVEIFECRLPARCFKLETRGITISTGTIDPEFIGRLALEISNGMIGFEK